MIRYFICENCHRGYDADDAGNTNCPYCQSDNVRPGRRPAGTIKYIGMFVLFAFFCALGVWLPNVLDGAGIKKNDTRITSNDKVQVTQPLEEQQVADTTMIPIIKQISTPVLSGETYRFQVVVEVPCGDKYKVELMEEFGMAPLYTSADGNFKNIPPINGGVYKVVAENIKTGDACRK